MRFSRILLIDALINLILSRPMVTAVGAVDLPWRSVREPGVVLVPSTLTGASWSVTIP